MSKHPINGEQPIENAPFIQLDNGASCIPQHYLNYCHSLSTIEQVIADCSFDDNYLILGGQDSLGLYVQIGVIGFDTYQAPQQQNKKKLVYGRRWRIEPHFPSSELIQTIYLATKKAREHEVRERLKIEVNGRYSAPFSTHQDLPLICQHFAQLGAIEQPDSYSHFRRNLSSIIKKLKFDHTQLQLLNIENRYKNQILVDIKIGTSSYAELPESQLAFLTIVLNQPSVNLFLHELMDALIKLSDDYVAEHFCYRNTPRFSKNLGVLQIAALSQQTRRKLPQPEHKAFYARLTEHNECVDKLRAPTLMSQSMSEYVARKLKAKNRALKGFLPTMCNK